MSIYPMNPPRRCTKTGLLCSCAPNATCDQTPNPYEAQPLLSGGVGYQPQGIDFDPPFCLPMQPREPVWDNLGSKPLSMDNILAASKHIQEKRKEWNKEDAEILAGIPMRPREAQRIPDLCPDDAYSSHGPACGCDDCEEERNR